jgi:uracil-DNA glycosylase
MHYYLQQQSPRIYIPSTYLHNNIINNNANNVSGCRRTRTRNVKKINYVLITSVYYYNVMRVHPPSAEYATCISTFPHRPLSLIIIAIVVLLGQCRYARILNMCTHIYQPARPFVATVRLFLSRSTGFIAL